MKKVIFLAGLLVLFSFTNVFAQGADITMPVTKSLDDPTPRSSVYPAAMTPSFLGYIIEQNGTLLSQTCAAGCPSLTVAGLPDGNYTFRMGAQVRGKITGGALATSVGWSTPQSYQVICGIPVPSAPVLGTPTAICK